MMEIIILLLDINECLQDPCDHYCVDSPGSYSCQCYPGWEYREEKQYCKGRFMNVS